MLERFFQFLPVVRLAAEFVSKLVEINGSARASGCPPNTEILVLAPPSVTVAMREKIILSG